MGDLPFCMMLSLYAHTQMGYDIATGFYVLPPFEKDNPKQFKYWFSQFFGQKGIVLNFWSEISKSWGFQKCITCVIKVLINKSTWCLFDENNVNLNK